MTSVHAQARAARLSAMAEVLNLFPEVAWDRTAAGGSNRVVYGWIPRADGRADFLLLEFTEAGAVGMTTSSSRYSLEFHRRLYNTDKGHSPCERVEHVFAGIDLATVITLEADDG